MHIHAAQLLRVPFDESGPAMDELSRGVIEVYGGKPQVLDPVCIVLAGRPAVFLAHVYDTGDAQPLETAGVASKWHGSQNQSLVYDIPPPPNAKDSTEQVVVGQSRLMDRACNPATHGSRPQIQAEPAALK
jgi:hypothetical protein